MYISLLCIEAYGGADRNTLPVFARIITYTPIKNGSKIRLYQMDHAPSCVRTAKAQSYTVFMLTRRANEPHFNTTTATSRRNKKNDKRDQ